MPETSWRRDKCVLVPDAHAMGSIAVIRSLGRAGYRVVAASARDDALGLRSAYASRALNCPSYGAGSNGFLAWLEQVVETEAVAAIVPSEGFLLAARPVFERYRRLFPMSGNPEIVYPAMSKCDLFARFDNTPLATGLPPYLLLNRNSSIPSARAIEDLGLPVYVKADAVHAVDGSDSVVRKCASAAAAHDVIATLLGRYGRVLVQGHVRGVGVGAFLLRWRGRILARFMHRRLHEVPHTGGASSYRRAWFDEAILQDAIRRAEALDWEGVGMFEYRWDPVSGQARLLEFNARFWGSLHLAIFAGVDFPKLLLDAFFGHESPCDEFDVRTACRWTFPREVEYVWSCWKDAQLPMTSRLGALVEFFRLGIDPRVRSDLNFPGDRALYWRAIGQSLSRWFAR